jgi:hypothetical protein
MSDVEGGAWGGGDEGWGWGGVVKVQKYTSHPVLQWRNFFSEPRNFFVDDSGLSATGSVRSGLNFYDESGRLSSVIFPSTSGQKLLLAG